MNTSPIPTLLLVLETAAEANLSLNQLRILLILHDSGPITCTALSHKIGITPAGITGAIDFLEKQYLLERIRTHLDRRLISVRLTDTGRLLACLVLAPTLPPAAAA